MIQPFSSSQANIFKLPLIVIFTIVVIFVTTIPVSSKTLDEINKEIAEKNKELETLEDALQEASENARYFESQKNSATSELERTENELKQIEAEISVNKVEMEKTLQELALVELELEQKGIVMGDKMVDLYIYERQGILDMVLENGKVDGFWKDVKYREALMDEDFSMIHLLAEEVAEVEEKRDSLEKSLTVLEEENERLAQEINKLEEQRAYYSSMSAYNTSKQEGLRVQMGAVQQEIEGLTSEQRIILDEETALIGDAHGGTAPLEGGEYYFYGRGRALYQGHGLGFSQYGAYGGAQNGMSADSISTFYYQGSYIGSASGNIEVIGYGVMNIEDYVSGLGEIPDKACGTQAQVNARPDKYALDNPNTIWDCWPEESIKAQVIVARSYGLAYGGAICTTATCQVYKGGFNKRWAAVETSGKVLMVGGTIIKAYYSSDNNNGWGSATHRNPVWCWDFYGNCGAGFSWLQAVNDSSFAAKGPYTDWVWRTNSYTLSEIQSMFEWYVNRGYYNSGNVRQLLNTIGAFQTFQIQRDASGRAAKIKAIGSSGSVDINGEIFKEIWNLWVGNVQPSGEVDPVFSITYHFRQV
jgi:SpoIID/LytB domain protein